jgi:hypothetical protein
MREKISTPVNERFLREGHLRRVVALRSIVDELTLVCVLIICSCIVEYSYVMNDIYINSPCSIIFLFIKHTRTHFLYKH